MSTMRHDEDLRDVTGVQARRLDDRHHECAWCANGARGSLERHGGVELKLCSVCYETLKRVFQDKPQSRDGDGS